MNNKNIHFVSSFSPDGFEKYGKKFIESFDSDNIKLFIGIEDDVSVYPIKKMFFILKYLKNFRSF